MALCPQIQVVFVDERTVQCGKRDIRQFVSHLQEPFDMVVGIAIGSQASCCAVYSHTLFKVADEPSEISQKRFLPAGHSKQYSFYLFGCHTVTDSRLFRIDAQCYRAYLIQTVVDFLSAILLPDARPEAQRDCGTFIFTLNAASEYFPTFNLAITGQFPSASASLFLR